MVFSTFFNLNLNFPVRSSWSEPQSAPGLVFAYCIELLHVRLQRISSIWFQYWPFGDVHVRAVSCVVGRGSLLWTVCSLGKTLLAFALLHLVLQGQTCLLLQLSLLSVTFQEIIAPQWHSLWFYPNSGTLWKPGHLWLTLIIIIFWYVRGRFERNTFYSQIVSYLRRQ